MEEFSTISGLRGALTAARRRTATIGFVPTMGNLHDGHLRLVEACRSRCDVTVVSIYVNPLQFGPNEDLASYPRTLDEDRSKLQRAGVDHLFVPGDAELYPDGRERQTRVIVPAVTDILCGKSRPGHFDGVATVVLKLFNVVHPDYAFFGKKDFQQLVVLQMMVRHLNVPVRLVGVETERAASGLALSSRNQYLTAAESNIAPLLQQTLAGVARQLRNGERDFSVLEATAVAQLASAGFQPDYVAICNPRELGRPNVADREFVILAAAWLGRARLIDNVHIALEESP
jgi:pantoate--beta-alanine ligase